MTLLETFFGPGNDLTLEELGDVAHERLRPWIERWRQGRGPAFLPRVRGSDLFWYGLMRDPHQRREVQELLVHWVGPACSDVDERRGTIDKADPFDSSLDTLLSERIVRLQVWPQSDTGVDPEAREKVRERLEGLVRALDSRPARRKPTRTALPALLDDLDLAATSGDEARATGLLQELEDRRLLDAPNTLFVAVRVWSLLGRHERVVRSDVLDELDGLRLPAGAVRHIARSAYQVWMRDADLRGDYEALHQLRSELPGALRHVLRQGQMSEDRPVVVARSVVLGDEPAIQQILQDIIPREPHLVSLVGGSSGTPVRGADAREAPEESGPVAVLASDQDMDVTANEGLIGGAPPVERSLSQQLTQLYGDGAYEAVISVAESADTQLDVSACTIVVLSAVEVGSNRTASIAIELVQRSLGAVDDVDWPGRLVRGAASELLQLARDPEIAIDSWDAWFEAVTSGRQIGDEVLDSSADWPPMSPDAFLETLEGLTDPNVLSPVIGRLRAAHAPILDDSGRSKMARTLLTVLAFSDRSNATIRVATYDLVVEALDAGLDEDEAVDLVATVSDLLIGQLNAGTVSWMIDVRSELGDALAVSHTETLAALDRRLLEKLRPLEAAISRADWDAYATLLKQVGLELPPDIAARLAEKEESDPLGCLAGMKILLYSLRQRAARQAAARLRAVEGVEVTLSAEHGGSSQLSGQVVGADIVVVVTAAAKHAATDFIESAGPQELIRVNSTGMSGILAALEERCEQNA